MPSPVGHALAGLAISWFIDARTWPLKAAIRRGAAWAAVAALPDLDLLLPITHRGPSHSIGAAVAAGIVAWVLTRRARNGVLFAIVYGSHILLDWLGTDTTAPIGVMALWPFSRAYFESPYHVFMAVSRRYWMPGFWSYNLRVLVREILILGPLVGTAAIVRGRRT